MVCGLFSGLGNKCIADLCCTMKKGNHITLSPLDDFLLEISKSYAGLNAEEVIQLIQLDCCSNCGWPLRQLLHLFNGLSLPLNVNKGKQIEIQMLKDFIKSEGQKRNSTELYNDKATA